MQVNVREERVLRTRTINNDLNPTWDQTFHFLVDSIDSQSLSESSPLVVGLFLLPHLSQVRLASRQNGVDMTVGRTSTALCH